MKSHLRTGSNEPAAFVIFGKLESADAANVRLERNLCFDFAKLIAKGQLRSVFMPQNEERPGRYFSASVDRTTLDQSRTEAIDPPNPMSSGEKRRLTRIEPELGAQKSQRRTGNLAEEVL